MSDLRIRDVLFLVGAFQTLMEVQIYYGISHARSFWNGVGCLLFSAAIIYGMGAIYDRWRVIRRNPK